MGGVANAQQIGAASKDDFAAVIQTGGFGRRLGDGAHGAR